MCPHGMPSPASCFECMEDGNLPLPPLTVAEEPDGPVSPAVFPGQCPVCEFPIVPGDRIVHTTRDRWLHSGCAA